MTFKLKDFELWNMNQQVWHKDFTESDETYIQQEDSDITRPIT